jgi:hypothetical protein
MLHVEQGDQVLIYNWNHAIIIPHTLVIQILTKECCLLTSRLKI